MELTGAWSAEHGRRVRQAAATPGPTTQGSLKPLSVHLTIIWRGRPTGGSRGRGRRGIGAVDQGGTTPAKTHRHHQFHPFWSRVARPLSSGAAHGPAGWPALAARLRRAGHATRDLHRASLLTLQTNKRHPRTLNITAVSVAVSRRERGAARRVGRALPPRRPSRKHGTRQRPPASARRYAAAGT